MVNNEIATELIQALIKVESDFGLSEILQTQGVLTNEPVTVEFKWGEEVLLTCQRELNSSSDQCSWIQANGKNIETLEERPLSENIGKEIAEVFSKAEMLPTFKSVLLKRGATISEEKPVIVQFKFNSLAVCLKCPCLPQRCCQIHC